MFFLGDISLPAGVKPKVVGFPKRLGRSGVATLEGAITDFPRQGRRQLCVHQGRRVAPFLEKLGVCAVSLATNHLLDAGKLIAPTRRILDEVGIQTFGGGDSIREAARGCVVTVAGEEVVLLGFGWRAIGCRKAGATRAGVNPMTLRNVLSSIERERARRPGAPIVVVVHWGYELETLPHPMQVDLARRAVDAGANAVIGSHSHCVLGAEVYGGAPILYGLGNWFVAEGSHFGWELRYPALSRRQLMFQMDLEGHHHKVHWFRSEPDAGRVVFRWTEALRDSADLATLSPFRGQTVEEYEPYFREHRRKTKGLPVYRRADATVENWFKDRWVGLRGAALKTGIRLGLKGGPR